MNAPVDNEQRRQFGIQEREIVFVRLSLFEVFLSP